MCYAFKGLTFHTLYLTFRTLLLSYFLPCIYYVDIYIFITCIWPFVCNKLFIIIFQKGVFPDLLATSGDYLRVWRVNEAETRLECLLNNVCNKKTHLHMR